MWALFTGHVIGEVQIATVLYQRVESVRAGRAHEAEVYRPSVGSATLRASKPGSGGRELARCTSVVSTGACGDPCPTTVFNHVD